MNFSAEQKRSWNEKFNDVTELYQVLNEGRGTLRASKVNIVSHSRRQVTGLYYLSSLAFNHVEVESSPLDFLMDVELKAARVLPTHIYNEFLRLAEVGEMRLLPETAKVLLGQVWTEYNLGVDGSYAKLYFNTKNEQIRNYMKEKFNGPSDVDSRPQFD